MKLFYAPPSPFARKVRVLARERTMMDQIKEIMVNPYQDDPRLLAVNPAGLVPALVLADGAPLMDSRLICQHLEAVAGLGGHVKNSDHVRRMHQGALGDAILDFAVASVGERRRTDASPSENFVGRKLAKIERCLGALPGGPERLTSDLSLVDITSGCALAYLDFRLPDFDWRGVRPDLAPWLEDLQRRPAFQQTQPAEYLH